MFSKKRSKGLKFLLSFLLLAGWAFQSCTDEGIIDAPTWHQTVEHGDNALVRDAKAMVDGTQGNLSMPDMFKTLGKTQTRVANSEPQTLASGSFTLDWEAAQSLYEEDGTVLLVPIRMKQNMAIWRFTVIDNKRKAEQTPMHSVLYVKKFDSTGNIMGRVLSYAPSRQYIKRHPKYHQRLEGYNPDRTDYSGLLLVSSLDGNLSHGFNYENGCRQFMFRPNIHAHEHSHEHESTPVTRALALPDSCQHNHTTDQKMVSIKSTVFNMRMISSTSAISTYSYNNETYEQPGCIFCGGNPYTCDCLIVSVCETCGNIPEDCICICDECNRKKANCICCILCNSFPCTCNNESGSSTGGSGGGGGGDGNNNSSNNGNNNNQNQGGGSHGSGIPSTSLPTITGGTEAQRATIQNIVNNLVSVYNLNMNGINIELMETDCSSNAKVIPGYLGIGICSKFFNYNSYDQTAILWHEVYHYQNDDRSWKDLEGEHDYIYVVPPANIIEDITYLIERDFGFTPDDSEWNSIYRDYIYVTNCFDPIFNQNEIDAYKAEINKFPNVSEQYAHDRNYELWLYETRKNKFH